MYGFLLFVEERLHAHRCQSSQQTERQIEQSMGCCVAGGLLLGANLLRGHRYTPGFRPVSVFPIQACYRYAENLACVEPCVLRGGLMLD